MQVVKRLAKDSRVDLIGSDYASIRYASFEKHENVVIWLFQDPRIKKSDVIKLFFGLYVKDLKFAYNLLLQSRLNMMLIYSKAFFDFSAIPRSLLNRINSFIQPYIELELDKFGEFIENLESKRVFGKIIYSDERVLISKKEKGKVEKKACFPKCSCFGKIFIGN